MAHRVEHLFPDGQLFVNLHGYDPAEPVTADQALRRFLRALGVPTAEAARSWISPAEASLTLTAATGSEPAPVFADYDTAVNWAEQGQAIFPRLVQAASAAELHTCAWQLAVSHWNAMSPAASFADWIESGQTGLEAAEQSAEPAPLLRVLTLLGAAYRHQNRLDDALGCPRRALVLARTSAARFDEARSLNLIGLIHLRTRRLDLAAEHFEEAAEIFHEQGEASRAATAQSNTARTRLSAGRLSEVRTVGRQALSAHRALGDAQGIGNALSIMAELLRETGEVSAARQAIDEALEIALALRDHTLEGYWLLTLGDVQRSADAYGDALISYQRSGMLHRRLRDRGREALAWRGTGQAYSAMRRESEAAAFHRRAAAVHGELSDDWHQAVDLNLLANAVASDDPHAAQAHWTYALDRLASFTDPRAQRLCASIRDHLAAAEG